MTIEGDYTAFAHLETVFLGTLARRTLIATNTARVLEAANGKPIIFMPARHDHHRVQTGDGYAAYVAGAVLGAAIGVTSDAQASWWGEGVGTVPHALIAAYGGNTVLAATSSRSGRRDFRITVLVDFENDSVRNARRRPRAGPRLWGVRLDTSGQLVDRLALGRAGRLRPAGVNERLVARCAPRSTRTASSVRICCRRRVHGREDRAVRAQRRPDRRVRGGSSLIRGENDFTADIVLTDGRPRARSVAASVRASASSA